MAEIQKEILVDCRCNGILSMKYKLKNNTSVPNKRIDEIIKFVSPKGIDSCDVFIDYCKDGSYLDGEAKPYGKNKFIKALFGKTNKYPRLSYPKKLQKVGYTPQLMIKNDDEAIFCILAHELRHIWQGEVTKQEFWTGKICKYTSWDGQEYKSVYKAEKDACKYTQKMLHKYRKLKGKL